MKTKPVTDAEIRSFPRALDDGDRYFKQTRDHLLEMRTDGADNVSLRAMLTKAGLVGVDLGKFCAADTMDKRLECIMKALDPSRN